MNVKNIAGTSNYTCNCVSWLEHWKTYSGQTANICRAKGCSEQAALGAHVLKDVGYDNKWYIVPFCNTHNKDISSIELVAGTNLVSANVSNTCG